MSTIGFCQLPVELRTYVYQYIFSGTEVHVYRREDDTGASHGPVVRDRDYRQRLALLFTCRLLYLEAQPFLAQSVGISFGYTAQPTDLRPTIQVNYLLYIQRIQIVYEKENPFHLAVFPRL